MYFAYLVQCADGTLYGGYTTDLQKRMEAHNSGKGAKYTRSRLPVELVYWEECPSKEEAMSREWHLKRLTRAQKLALMKKTAILINVARGPVVVTQDLADALNNGTIAAAGVDVFDKEPPLDLSEPLLNCKNCLVTPHVAFASQESMSLRAQIVFDNLAAWMQGNQQNVIL